MLHGLPWICQPYVKVRSTPNNDCLLFSNTENSNWSGIMAILGMIDRPGLLLYRNSVLFPFKDVVF